MAFNMHHRLCYTYLLGFKKDIEAAFALILLVLNFYFLYFVNFLYPDNVVAFFALAAAALYYTAKKAPSASKSWKGIAFMVCLFVAYLAKETAALVLPFFILSAIYAWFKNKSLRHFWIAAAATALFLGSVYLLYYYIETGNPFFRLTEMEEANLSYSNYVTNPHRAYFKRLTWGPIAAIISTGTFIPLVLMMGGKRC
ncbi:hypothetical protein [Pontibacter rugosus]